MSEQPNKAIFAIHVPQGTTAHQAPDGRYYKRDGDTTKIMEHHEIVDVMNRCKHPVIEPSFRHEKLTIDQAMSLNQYEKFPAGALRRDLMGGFMHVYKLKITLKNIGVLCAEHIKLIIEMPKAIVYVVANYTDQRGTDNGLFQNVIVGDKIVKVDLRYNKPQYMLYPDDLNETAFNFFYFVDERIYADILNYNIVYKLYADNMPPKGESLPLSKFNCF